MTTEEAKKFETLKHFEALVKMRDWDDRGKIKNAPVDPLEKYENMCKNYLEKVHSKFWTANKLTAYKCNRSCLLKKDWVIVQWVLRTGFQIWYEGCAALMRDFGIDFGHSVLGIPAFWASAFPNP